MCIVVKHPSFDAYVHEIELNAPDIGIHDFLIGVKWELEHGAKLGIYIPELDVYRITLPRIQLQYKKVEAVGERTRITLLRVVLRPTSGGIAESN